MQFVISIIFAVATLVILSINLSPALHTVQHLTACATFGISAILLFIE